MTGKLEDGKCVWVDDAGMGTTFDMTSVHVDHMLFMSGKPGQGVPGIFTPVNAKGDTNYGAGCTLFSAAGVSYDRADGFLPAELWRQKTTADYDFDGTLISDPSCIEAIYDSGSYQNIINNDVEGLKPHDTAYDTFYEIKIPLKVLGITRQWLEANGIGCRVIGTRGESAIDCCPFDPAMIDNAFECYGKDASTTGEKDDLDIITYAMADIAKVRDLSNIEPLPIPPPILIRILLPTLTRIPLPTLIPLLSTAAMPYTTSALITPPPTPISGTVVTAIKSIPANGPALQ